MWIVGVVGVLAVAAAIVFGATAQGRPRATGSPLLGAGVSVLAVSGVLLWWVGWNLSATLLPLGLVFVVLGASQRWRHYA